jgi:hypothetical protein
MAPAVCNQNTPDYMATIPTLLNQFRRHINHLMALRADQDGAGYPRRAQGTALEAPKRTAFKARERAKFRSRLAGPLHAF